MLQRKRNPRGRTQSPMVVHLHVPMFAMCFLMFFVFQNARSQSPLVSFDKIFDQFNGVAVWAAVSPSTWHHHDFPANDFLGIPHVPFRYGFELLLGPYPEKKGNPIVDSLTRLLKSRVVTRYKNSLSMKSTDDLIMRLDSLRDWFLKRKTQISKGKVLGRHNPLPEGVDFDSVASLMYAINLLESRDRNEEEKKWKVEGGLGIDFSDSYRGKDTVNIMRIPVRAYYLSGYVDPPCKICRDVSWFLGLTGGFYAISNGTMYQPDSAKHFSISGSTLGFETVIGLALKLGGSSQVFLEFSYQYLAFEGVQYSNGVALALPNTAPTAPRAPSRIDLSGFHITLGFQGARKE